jgi:hypothetical protein
MREIFQVLRPLVHQISPTHTRNDYEKSVQPMFCLPKGFKVGICPWSLGLAAQLPKRFRESNQAPELLGGAKLGTHTLFSLALLLTQCYTGQWRFK